MGSLGIEKVSNRWLPIFIAGCTSPAAASPQGSKQTLRRTEHHHVEKKRSISDFFFGHIKIDMLRPIGGYVPYDKIAMRR